MAFETVARDIGDQVFERLAELPAGRAPLDSSAYLPRLASHWERIDSLTWRFHLRPGARWHDGQPVTAGDVVFSFEAFVRPALETTAGEQLRGRLRAEAQDSATVLIHFTTFYPEQLFDATWHVRVLPAHIWTTIPDSTWGADTTLGHLVGSGPYRVSSWIRGQSLTLEADPGFRPQPAIRRAIWRFAEDPDAALNLILSHEADLMEAVGSVERVQRVERDTLFEARRYPSAVYGFLGYQLSAVGREGATGQSTARGRGRLSPLSDRAVRRALNMSVDRARIARAVFGPDTKAPPGPMSQLLWLWDDSIATLPFDSAVAARELDSAGWRRDAGGQRRKSGKMLGFDILVPTTSLTRKAVAQVLQESWRGIGATVTVTAVDFPVFQQRLGKGEFDSYVAAYLDEPSPRSLGDQWSRSGWDALNYGRYANPQFDRLLQEVMDATTPEAARLAWREAMDTLNADAPALFLYAPTNVAAVARRLQGVAIDPYSWLSGLRDWRLDQERSRALDAHR